MGTQNGFIRIVARPPGGAPDEIREQWVGLNIPLVRESKDALLGDVLTGELVKDRRGGYEVRWSEAMQVLYQNRPDAHRWWQEHVSPQTLVFSPEVCERSMYGRAPGSTQKVSEAYWADDAPFGRCPACGSLAMEDIPIPGSPDINFYCSDTTCRDQEGRRTMWGDNKPQELLDMEKSGCSWNQKHWPGQDADTCPD